MGDDLSKDVLNDLREKKEDDKMAKGVFGKLKNALGKNDERLDLPEAPSTDLPPLPSTPGGLSDQVQSAGDQAPGTEQATGPDVQAGEQDVGADQSATSPAQSTGQDDTTQPGEAPAQSDADGLGQPVNQSDQAFPTGAPVQSN
ncbi:MAG: hypothetical protein ACQESG_03210, partial [Nanobdellota archaeon]